MTTCARTCSRATAVLTLAFLCCACRTSAAESRPPRSASALLDNAAATFANGDFTAGRKHFEEASEGPSTPVYLRGLALFGAAQACLIGKETNSALGQLDRIARDRELPEWQRQSAARVAREVRRVGQGLAARDPQDYRVQLPRLPAAGVVFHVSPSGSDENSGTQSGPFATLERARDAIRALKGNDKGLLPKGGVLVDVAPGLYVLHKPLSLSAQDSGTAEAPVVYKAQAGSSIFSGGLPVTGWKPVTDADARARLQPSVSRKVLEADLKANGITNWGDATALKLRPELFVNGVPQTLSRWPNEGFVKTGEILGKDTFKVWGSISGCKDGKFRFEQDQPTTWSKEPDVRLYGYWFWDWFEGFQTVQSIDPADRSFTLAKPYSAYGYRKGQRYFAVNLLCELDAPGEWYLDRRSGKAYWLPPQDVDVNKAETVISVSSESFFQLQNATNVVILGFTFQDSRGDGIRVNGGADCLIAGCEVRRLGGDAIVLEGGHHNGIFGCSMHTLGCGAMRVNGGNRRSLEPGRHFVENCFVSDIARLKRTYAPAVHLDGCGNRIAHNLFERVPSSAMRIEGNDHLVELNEIRNVVQESDDQGGIDMFGNPLYRGTVIRWNRWSDIIGGTECGAAGIRLDDMISGTVIQGNLFERCGAVQFGAVQIHGGKDNYVDGNAFVDCHAAASFSRWDEPRWLKAIEPFLNEATKQPYSTRYPDVTQLKSGANVNFLSRNLVVNCKNVFLRDGGVPQSVLMSIQQSGSDLVHELESGGPSTRKVLLEPIPISEMGCYPHPWRHPGIYRNETPKAAKL